MGLGHLQSQYRLKLDKSILLSYHFRAKMLFNLADEISKNRKTL